MGAAPLISIVIATRDAARRLPRCLESLRAQAFRGFEAVVIDGGSSDGTVDLLKSSGDVVAAWRSAPDAGPYSAWNAALPLARGEWICFLGADDWLWDAGSLERLVPHLRGALPRHRVVYGRLRLVDEAGRVVEERGRPWPELRPRFLAHECLPHPGLMHHRSLFERHGRFDESFRIAADYEFLLRELTTGEALFVPELVAGAGWGGLSTTPENFAQSLHEIERALRMHGLRPPFPKWPYWKLLARAYLGLHALVGRERARRLADLYRALTFRKPRYAARRGDPAR